MFTEGRPGDFSGKEVSSERAERELNWQPKVLFKEGVRRYIEWYKELSEEQALEATAVDQDLVR